MCFAVLLKNIILCLLFSIKRIYCVFETQRDANDTHRRALTTLRTDNATHATPPQGNCTTAPLRKPPTAREQSDQSIRTTQRTAHAATDHSTRDTPTPANRLQAAPNPPTPTTQYTTQHKKQTPGEPQNWREPEAPHTTAPQAEPLRGHVALGAAGITSPRKTET